MQSTSFFLSVMKVKFRQWIFFNSCAVANFVFLCGLCVNSSSMVAHPNRLLIHAALPGMAYYGGLGLFVFPWRLDFSLIPQISHVIMSLNVVNEVVESVKTRDYENGFLGLGLGLLAWLPFIYLQNKYIYTHPEEVDAILFNPEENEGNAK